MCSHKVCVNDNNRGLWAVGGNCLAGVKPHRPSHVLIELRVLSVGNTGTMPGARVDTNVHARQKGRNA